MTIAELLVNLGFNADTLKVKDFSKAVGEIPLDVAGAIVALAGIEIELAKVAEQAMNTAVGFQMFTSQTGLSWQELQKWQIVAEQANVSAASVASSVNALERNMAEIRLGRGNIAPFQMLGIGVNQNAFGVLAQLRERIKGLNRATATNMITQMGLSPEMIQVLALSNREFEKMSKNVAGMSGEQEGSFLKAKQSLVEFGQVARYIGFDIVAHLTENLSLLLAKLKEFKSIAIIVGVALASLAIYFFPITAAVVGLMLVLDDLSVYFRGGHSLFGLAMDGLTKIAGKVQSIFPTMGTLGKLMGAMPLMPMGVVPMMIQSAMGHAAAGTQPITGAPLAGSVTQTNTIHVHSTAPAEDVGKAVKKEIDKGVAHAATQTNNQGY